MMMNLYLISGVLYRLTSDLKIGSCMFKKGEFVTYCSGGYSHYDDCYIYHFINAVGKKHMCTSKAKLTVVEIESFEKVSDVTF
jgi:hypothetical protein